MRFLAEFVMRGRAQAVMVSVLGVGSVLFAWLGAAVVALVTLRKGIGQGGYVLLWAMLPALAIAVMGADLGPVATLLGSALAAAVLRFTMSWPQALLAVVVSGLLTAAAMVTLGSEQIALMQDLLKQISEQMQSEGAGAQGQAQIQMLGQFTASDIAGLVGLSNAATVAVCLLLARWAQALLYNPGGFQQEFHSLRMVPLVTVLLLAAMLLLASAGEAYRLWLPMFLLPLFLAGLGLVHTLAARWQLARFWLVIFYIAWVLIAPLRFAVVLLAVLDSWIDIRKRLPAPPGAGGD